MRSSCIPHPAKESLIVIRQWQVEFCNGDHCGAALLGFFEYWHNIKLAQSFKAVQQNDVAEMHGDQRTQDESLFQFHTEEDLIAGLLGLYKRDRIRRSIKSLEESGAISIHSNPNPKYKFDRTRYFLFHPEIVISYLDQRKNDNRDRKTDDSGRKIGDCGRNLARDLYIPKTTSETTKAESFLSEEEIKDQSNQESYFLKPDRVELNRNTESGNGEANRSNHSSVKKGSGETEQTGEDEYSAAPIFLPREEIHPCVRSESLLRVESLPVWRVKRGPNGWNEEFLEYIRKVLESVTGKSMSRGNAISYIAKRERLDSAEYSVLLGYARDFEELKRKKETPQYQVVDQPPEHMKPNPIPESVRLQMAEWRRRSVVGG